MPEPIEIRPSDIIKRPDFLTAKAGAEAGGFSVKNIKGYIQPIKEIKDLMDDLGIDLGGLGLNLGGGKKAATPPGPDRPPAMTGAQQFRNFLKLLEMKYGDITVNELLDKLRAEFGDWKISNFTKGGIV